MNLTPDELRSAFKRLLAGDDDFQLAVKAGSGYVARTKGGGVAWVVPLESVPETAGRRAGGFSLSPMATVAFEFDGKKWKAPAAVWESTELGLLDTFLVLVGDASVRLGASPNWKEIVEYVDEWQSLLARRPTLTTEQQLGLWAELSVIARAAKPDEVIDGWRGPDGDPIDFFLKEVGLEVKASRRQHAHHVSQSQASRPVGVREAFTLSFWVGQDPSAGRSIVDIIDETLKRIVEKPVFLRKLAKVGFSVAEQEAYRGTRFVELEPPLLFRTEDVPRVHEVDRAISELRYLVTLDASRALDEPETMRVYKHFGVDLESNTGGEGRK